MNRKSLAFGAVIVAALMLATTGCTTTAATPVSQPSSAGQPAVTQTITARTTASPAACPVDAATLEKAFKANAGLSSALVLGGGLDRITCYQGYAVAHTTPTTVDPALVLFAYDRATQTWTAVTGGTAVRCAQYVPAAVVAHLPGCAAP